jgi:DnaJ family protein C protein 28
MSLDAENDPRVLRSRAATPEHAPEESRPVRAREAAARLRVRDTLIERIIRDAQAAGAFDNLPYVGERLPMEDDAAAGEMASAFRILRNAGAAPEWIETAKEIRRLLGHRETLLERAARAGPLARERYRADLRRLVADVNRLTFVLNYEAPSMQQHRRMLDLAQELEALEQRWPT